jgi:anaerobic selenocysteine-containing dehydrogenase
VVLKEIADDPARTMIVIDPRRSETAKMADIHLQVRPGTDAWCLAAILGVLVQEDLINHAFLDEHATGVEEVVAVLRHVPVGEYASRSGIAEGLLRAAARRIGEATGGVTTYEDLGVQQAPQSTLVSYLNKLLWILTGNFARPGGMYLHSWFVPLDGGESMRGGGAGGGKRARPPSVLRTRMRRLSRRAAASGGEFLSATVAALADTPATRRLVEHSARGLLSTFARLARTRPPAVPADGSGVQAGGRRTPVTGARIIGGLVPCNSIAEEILTDHPDRFRAMWIDSVNPAHSLADSHRFREALDALDLVVVVDVAFTETARRAHYVLPAASQFEKWEATFFNFEFPRNVFHLRAPIVDPLPGTLAEPEIYARLVRALGVVNERLLARLRKASKAGRSAFALAFFAALASNAKLAGLAPYILYETLGETLPEGARSAAALWGASHLCALNNPSAVRRAGFDGPGLEPGEKLFEALLRSRSGIVFTVDEWKDVWSYVRRPDRRLTIVIPELLERLRGLASERSEWTSEAYPFVLSAGERRSFTANTIIRDPAWRKKDARGALRMSAIDAEQLGLVDGDGVRVVTERGAAEAVVEVSDMMQTRHISLPNGLGVDYPESSDGHLRRTGVAPNELTSLHHRDWFAGTPWHKHVPARVEPLRSSERGVTPDRETS